MKKTLSVILALALLLLLSVSALAANEKFEIDEFFGVLTKYNGPGGDVVIPAGVKKIGDGAFGECEAMTSVTIPDGVTRIGTGAFALCSGLTSVALPDSVSVIGESAFNMCINLTRVNIPDGVARIEMQAFYMCGGRDGGFDVEIPDSVTSIGFMAFAYTKFQRDLVLPPKLKTIESGAFFSCDLKSVSIPASVTTIEDSAFSCNRLLISFDVDKDNPSYSSVNGILCDKSGTTLITYPGGRSGLCRIPSDVTLIGTDAFDGCDKMTGVTIPAGVTEIADYAFWRCELLTDVYYAGSEEQWKAVQIGESNDSLSASVIHYNSEEARETTRFADVDTGAYYAEAVDWAVRSKVTNGTKLNDENGLNWFSPDATVTRGQAVTFLWRAMGGPEPKTKINPFADVKETDYFYSAVLWAVENGITNGTKLNDENGQSWFAPGGPVTRGQMLTFLWRTAGEPGKTGEGPWYADAERWGNATGCIYGTEETYSTDAQCPRSDVVYYLWKIVPSFS